ncbi:MAG: undecaprenyl/decaprenyl-phosphate alpha-N-acetylglucosaminyl 1-phosphate transferase [Bacteroidetes bacterium HGW-Bacteroidetes-4]|jgi:UDP-N-acetylmuramyl pentapeptide phosphotransferase/UDP-N-acetylglucosamine-1-phosphate transferase|nr:MAG: undecaprenyl/decaprenyl-phosphate alpha-N-acetylglucosaminyl 1-phosphate transferase [Bacteroidetes bacterium HGW-Bacteroidetes-4]
MPFSVELNSLLALFFALITTYFTIPVIIGIAKTKHLYDIPGERASHNEAIPTLGGLGIFIGFILSMTLFTDFKVFSGLQYLEFAFVFAFFMGMKDDIIALDPTKKAIGLFLSVAAIVILGDVRITSFYGLFGVRDLAYWFSVVFTMFTFLTIINAVNLIDGINGLCTSSSLISSLAFGIWFYLEGSAQSMQMVIIIAAVIGSLLGFLKYNVTPARIFMGDTGSLLLGVLLAFFAIQFLETNKDYTGLYKIQSSPVVAMSFIALPLVDMVKVFIIRLYKKRSPFKPDKNHIHHVLLKLGYSHTKATAILSVFSLLFILLALLTHTMRFQTITLVIIAFAAVLFPSMVLKRRER